MCIGQDKVTRKSKVRLWFRRLATAAFDDF